MMTDDQKDEYAQRVNTEKLEAERTMSATNPEQPAPTPVRITLEVEFPSVSETPRIGKDSLGQLWNCKIVSLAFEQSAPVPDAGVREKVMAILIEPATGSRTVRELADRILALFPAPTPATSEDTLMLDWLEDNAATLSHERGAGRYPWQVNWWTGTRKELVHRNTCEPTARQALRAAGEQKT